MTFPGSAPKFAEFVGQWMSRQRWFANKGSLPAIEIVGSWGMRAQDPTVEIATLLLLDHTPGKSALYQVPLVHRLVEAPDAVGLIGEFENRFVYDAPHDAAYTSALLTLVTGERVVRGDRMLASGHRSTGDVASSIAQSDFTSRVLAGEQSNTSIIFEPTSLRADTAPTVSVMCKLFRTIHDGENPDVQLQSALAAAGSTAVPQPIGHVRAEWNDKNAPFGRARGHLVCAQEFLSGAQDAWTLALQAASSGAEFAREARAMGVVTAQIHATLAATLPTRATDVDDVESILQRMNGRLRDAIAEVPDLERFATGLAKIFERARIVEWPAQQRVHGDLHLGQVLAVPDRGWVVVDFEGEPLRPMSERVLLDSPMRDVAGMLRSFDYAAGSVAMSEETIHPLSWVDAARAAFIAGYVEAAGAEILENSALIDAFEVDKALYETVYEARNRPAWLPIPVAAIERLAARFVD